MKIQTYSIIAGTDACNAQCPYCVSKMTPDLGVADRKPGDVNWRNFEVGVRFAQNAGVSTALITGKGEPTLFPEQITAYLEKLQNRFPFIELQTNGIALWQKHSELEETLKRWYGLGLTTVAVSAVHYDNERNKEIFQPHGKYMDLPDLIEKLHTTGYSVRLSTVLLKGYIDDVGGIEKLVDFAQEYRVEQLTVRPVTRPQTGRDNGVVDYVDRHILSDDRVEEIRRFLDEKGTSIMSLVHGAVIYDFKGQNICLTNALTIEPKSEEVRQLIFFPDGHLRYDWQYMGAILL